jgi:hypothetical protein
MLSNVSKMPGKSISLSAFDCQTGEKLSKIPGSVCHDCYARKGMYRMPNVINKMEERKEFFDSIDFVPRMIGLLNKTRSEYFRWFDSGDVQSVRMALNILDVVEATPGKRHWIPTKERAIWLETIKQYGRKLPDNLVIRYSATMVDQAPPESWAHSSAVVKSIDAIGHECPAPTQQGKCGECRACWDKNVKTVSYHKH